MKKLGIAVFVLTLMGCVSSHITQGDRAAQSGNWKAAEQSYRYALGEESDDTKVQRKHKEAWENAIAQSLRFGRACLLAENFDCAQSEVLYIHAINPGNANARQMDSDIYKGKAVRQEKLAREAERRSKARIAAHQKNALIQLEKILGIAKHGQCLKALEELASRRSGSDGPEVKARDIEVRDQIATYAYDRVTELRASSVSADVEVKYGTLAEAVRILTLLNTDSSLSQLRTLTSDFNHAKTDYTRKFTKQGEAHVASGNWQLATIAFKKVSVVEPKFRSRARYCELTDFSIGAIARREFAPAEKALRDAIKVAPAASKEARALFEKVQPRNYKITLESVVVSPARPGTSPPQPWVGKPDGSFGFLVGAALTVSGAGILVAGQGKKLADKLDAISYDARPNVRIIVGLPDGRQLVSGIDKTFFKTVEASLVVNTNSYDSRFVSVTAFHEVGKKRETMGTVQVPLGDIVSGNPIQLPRNGQSGLLHVQFRVAPGANTVGTTVGWAANNNSQNRLRKVVQPPPGGTPFRLLQTHIILAKKHDNDPYFQIRQGGDAIFRSTHHDNDRDTTWTPNWVFFVKHGEPIVVEVWDDDSLSGNDQLLKAELDYSQIATGKALVNFKDGSRLELSFARVESGPR